MSEASPSQPSQTVTATGVQPALSAVRLGVQAAKRPGRSHRRLDVPCQDAHAQWVSPDGSRAAAAVADGLGSQPLSQHGSQAAVDAAVAALAAEPVWDEAALRRAFAAAREAVAEAAARLGAPLDRLATTLQVAASDGAIVLAGMVGDGAIVAGSPAQVVLAPATDGYANEVVPLTARDWDDFLQVSRRESSGPIFLFSDGLTRLLLARLDGTWAPFSPFFEAFLPALAADSQGRLVQRFIAGDDVDKSWDDDKCLAVISNAPA